MSWMGDWIPRLAEREHETARAADESLHALGFVSDRAGGWTHERHKVTVSYRGVSRVLPFDESLPTPPELAGWYLVGRPSEDDRRATTLALQAARTLAAATRTFTVIADGLGYELHDGREASGVANALELLLRVDDAEDDDDDAEIEVPWGSLPGPSLGPIVIVYRGNVAFSGEALQRATQELAMDTVVSGPTGVRWQKLLVKDPSNAWALELDRGPSQKVPFYVRATFDDCRRSLGPIMSSPPLFRPYEATRESLAPVVDFARAFDKNVAGVLGLVPIDVEIR